MDVRILFPIVLLGLFSCSESVEKMDNSDVSTHLSGMKFYEQRCAVCHGNDGKLGVSDAKDLSKSNLSDKEVENIINKGKNGMPPFQHTIESDSTLIELIEHIKLLRE